MTRGACFGSLLAVGRAPGAARARRGGQVLAWTEDNLLRQVAYEGQREDKSSIEPKRQNLAGWALGCSGARTVFAWGTDPPCSIPAWSPLYKDPSTRLMI
jgi:hypothetical protein